MMTANPSQSNAQLEMYYELLTTHELKKFTIIIHYRMIVRLVCMRIVK